MAHRVNIPTHQDPITTVNAWLDAAATSESFNPTAAALATIDPSGAPSVRMVLLKGVDPTGFVFYTNLESRKGTHLAADPRAALCLYWKTLRRQIRVEGAVVAVSSDEADAYFASRDRGSQIGAWASHQSATLVSRAQLEADVADTQQRFGDADVPRPAFWSGYRLMPDLIEFWWELPSRLHERVEFRRSATGDWGHRLLYP